VCGQRLDADGRERRRAVRARRERPVAPGRAREQ
jgi:hypothetical protein